jgi:aldose 1-epimerase
MKFIKQFFYGLSIVGMLILSVMCKDEKKKEVTQKIEKVSLEKNEFGATPDGGKVDRYTLKNSSGMTVDIITYGGIITSIKVPNKEGVSEDVVLGFDNLDQYMESSPYFGAIIGRYGNRIAKGKFSLDGTNYSLAINNGENHLHGGIKGFDKVVWKASEETGENFAALKLVYVSKDMEEGYPGSLNTTVTYTLKEDNSLDMAYEATTDKKTIVNLTNHSYFNLSGDFSKTVLDQVLSLNADKYLPVDNTLIPTGEIADVENTPFDFRKPTSIGSRIEADDNQLKKGGGYDHCWILNGQDKGHRLVGTAYDPASGRVLEVFTSEPGVQFYSGNFLDGTLPAKHGGTYKKRSGFCLETQHYPNSPNQFDFPSVILNPGETYSSKTTFKFSTK